MNIKRPAIANLRPFGPKVRVEFGWRQTPRGGEPRSDRGHGAEGSCGVWLAPNSARRRTAIGSRAWGRRFVWSLAGAKLREAANRDRIEDMGPKVRVDFGWRQTPRGGEPRSDRGHGAEGSCGFWLAPNSAKRRTAIGSRTWGRRFVWILAGAKLREAANPDRLEGVSSARKRVKEAQPHAKVSR